ncbi:MAG: T9SS type A sorting domain-containing protein, partial [Bacteroidota bacterium]
DMVHAQSFYSLLPGFNFPVRTLFYDTVGGTLYAGGDFWKLYNGTAMNYISRWNGTNWDSLGYGLDAHALSIVRYNNQIIAGGTFNFAGSQVCRGLAIWDGNNWVHFADTKSPSGYGCVWALFVDGNDLYVGGCFDSINGIYSIGFARFDGTSWYSYPPLGFVHAINKFNGEIYVGGDFNVGVGKKDFVKWNGTNWTSVGGSFSGLNSNVSCMTVFQGQLYVGGYFFSSQGDPGNNIASWNGTSWSQPGSGVFPWNVLGMHVFKNELYIGGQINDAGGIPVTGIAKWDGFNWYSLGSTFDNNSGCFASNNNDLYIGGGFGTINGDTMMYITRYSPPLGVQENTWNTSGITLTPNPANGNFSLTSLFYTIESTRIYDFSGKIIFSNNKVLSNSYECKLNAPDGIYIAEVFINGNGYRSKMVVTH